MRRQMQLDFSKITTYSSENRYNLVTLESLLNQGEEALPLWTAENFDKLVRKIHHLGYFSQQQVLYCLPKDKF